MKLEPHATLDKIILCESKPSDSLYPQITQRPYTGIYTTFISWICKWNTGSLGMEIQKGLGKGCRKCHFSPPHTRICWQHYSGAGLLHGCYRCKMPHDGIWRRTLQDQYDLAAGFQGNRFAHKARDLRAIRSFRLWSFLVHKVQKIFTFNMQVLSSVPWQQLALIICVLTGLQRDPMWPQGKGRKLIIRWQKNALIVSTNTYKQTFPEHHTPIQIRHSRGTEWVC